MLCRIAYSETITSEEMRNTANWLAGVLRQKEVFSECKLTERKFLHYSQYIIKEYCQKST